MIKPIGCEQKRGKYTLVKISHNKWKYKHIHVWEQFHNKTVPDNHSIKFVDKNPNNFAIENLQCITKGTQASRSIGSEYKSGKYTLVKISHNKWKYKHVHIWEQFHNKTVPANHIVKILDNNPNNFAIENLKCMPKGAQTSRPIGSEQKNGKYTLVKISHNKWKYKHIHVWEQFHKRKVPDNHSIKFVDKNPNNFAIENLQCIQKGLEKSRPIGSESKARKYVRLKISHNKWKYKHVHIWEQFHNKAVPNNHAIKFVDKNPNNFAIENLKCVSVGTEKSSPIGSEYKNGVYTRIKISERRWRHKHVHIWEQFHNTPVPNNHVIIFLDQNHNNFSVDNLECISRNELAVLNYNQHLSPHLELTKIGILIAKIKIALSKQKKKHEKQKKRQSYE